MILNENCTVMDSNKREASKTTIYIVRHGESIGNFKREFLGHTDKDLTELGYRQAECTARELSDVDFYRIYSSDLQRAFHTAEPHAKLRDMSIIPLKELREMYVGEWEGRRVDDLIAEYGEKFTVRWKQQFGTFDCAPGGESTQDCAKRFYNAILEIGRENEGKTVLVASHAAAIRGFWGLISGVSPEELCDKIPFPTNASYSIVEYSDGRLTPVSFSSDKHLIAFKEGKPWY